MTHPTKQSDPLPQYPIPLLPLIKIRKVGRERGRKREREKERERERDREREREIGRERGRESEREKEIDGNSYNVCYVK